MDASETPIDAPHGGGLAQTGGGLAATVPKDVVAGETRSLACGETVDGVLDPATDEILDEARPVDRYTVFVDLPHDDTVRLVGEGFTPLLVVEAPETRVPPIRISGNTSGVAELRLRELFAQDFRVQVSTLVADEFGEYTLSLDCEPATISDFFLPREVPGLHDRVGSWSGIYRRLRDDDSFARGVGFALDIQKDALFGVRYDYDDLGAPRFLTYQGARRPEAERTYAGTIFRTAGGSSTEPVGSFDIELTSEHFSAFVMNSRVDKEEAEVTRWFSFIFGDYGPLFAEGATMRLEVETDDPEERAFLDLIGDRIRFDIRAETFAQAVRAESLDGRFDGQLSFPTGPDGQRGVAGLALFDSEREDDRLSLFLMISPHGFTGTATIVLDGRRGPIRNASGQIISSRRQIPN